MKMKFDKKSKYPARKKNGLIWTCRTLELLKLFRIATSSMLIRYNIPTYILNTYMHVYCVY